LATFVVYHPLNALTFYPVGRSTFMNPVFLLLAAILGVACSIAYLQSGSLACGGRSLACSDSLAAATGRLQEAVWLNVKSPA